MANYLQCGSLTLIIFILSMVNFNEIKAERAAWGGNGGWWGGGNREWEGDYDGPGYHRPSYNYKYDYCAFRYNHYGYSNAACYGCYGTPRTRYYCDESVPGAALYFNFRNQCR